VWERKGRREEGGRSRMDLVVERRDEEGEPWGGEGKISKHDMRDEKRPSKDPSFSPAIKMAWGMEVRRGRRKGLEGGL